MQKDKMPEYVCEFLKDEDGIYVQTFLTGSRCRTRHRKDYATL